MDDAVPSSEAHYYAHPTAVVDPGAVIGAGTSIWHFVHVMPGARIGEDCVFGHACFVGNVRIGDRVRVQNHVSIFDGVELENDVFCGPSCVFTNVINPRATVSRKHELRTTRVGRGATIGANATLICGIDIGEHAFIAAGAVARSDVPAHAVVAGVPARRIGWMCACGERLSDPRPADPRCDRCRRHRI